MAVPVLGPEGITYLGTSEGYVHALGSDGGYLWGYTLRGPVIGALALSATFTVLVPTPRRIYAIRPDGSLLWVFESPIPIQAGLATDGRGRYFFASEGKLFALSGRGALIAHVPGTVPFSSAPVALGEAIGIARSDGSVLLALLGKNRRVELGAPASELLTCPGLDFCALSRGELLGVASDGPRFRHLATLAGTSADRVAVVSPARVLEVYALARAERVFAAPLPAEASAAPLVDPAGRVFVPLASGALLGFSEAGVPITCTKVADSPLSTPVYDAPRQRVLVTASEGVLAAVRVD